MFQCCEVMDDTKPTEGITPNSLKHGSDPSSLLFPKRDYSQLWTSLYNPKYTDSFSLNQENDDDLIALNLLMKTFYGIVVKTKGHNKKLNDEVIKLNATIESLEEKQCQLEDQIFKLKDSREAHLLDLQEQKILKFEGVISKLLQVLGSKEKSTILKKFVEDPDLVKLIKYSESEKIECGKRSSPLKPKVTDVVSGSPVSVPIEILYVSKHKSKEPRKSKGLRNGLVSKKAKLDIKFQSPTSIKQSRSPSDVMKNPVINISSDDDFEETNFDLGSERNDHGNSQVKTSHVDSFDFIPGEKDLDYKYKRDALRKKNARLKLPGHDCDLCKQFYDAAGLDSEERNNRMNKCSRHRAKHVDPSTPPGFWDPDFPDTEECRAKGYLHTTKINLDPR